jgi:hypothetical protein
VNLSWNNLCLLKEEITPVANSFPRDSQFPWCLSSLFLVYHSFTRRVPLIMGYVYSNPLIWYVDRWCEWSQTPMRGKTNWLMGMRMDHPVNKIYSDGLHFKWLPEAATEQLAWIGRPNSVSDHTQILDLHIFSSLEGFVQNIVACMQRRNLFKIFGATSFWTFYWQLLVHVYCYHFEVNLGSHGQQSGQAKGLDPFLNCFENAAYHNPILP